MQNTPKIDIEAARACGDYESLGFKPRTFRHQRGLMLDIDDNFRIFCVPNPNTLSYELLGGNSKIKILDWGVTTDHMAEMFHTTDKFRQVILLAEDYLSKTGTMYTYGSINLKTKTGVSPAQYK